MTKSLTHWIDSRPRISLLSSAIALIVITTVHRVGPAYVPQIQQPGSVFSTNHAWELKTRFDGQDLVYEVFDSESGRHAWTSASIRGLGHWSPHEFAFLSNDGQRLIVVEPFLNLPVYGAAVRFFDPSGLYASVVGWEINKSPRLYYPLEARPKWNVPMAWWLSDVKLDGNILHVQTTGLFNTDIDIDKCAIIKRSINWWTVGRWSTYATILLVPALVILRHCYLMTCKIDRWWRKRRLENRGKCTTCGYSLYGLQNTRCPECGTTFDPRSIPETLRPTVEIQEI